jgi:hypothetical protein
MYDQVPDLLDNLWTALRDTKVPVREAAATALSRCLAIASQREGSLNEECYLMVFEQAQRGLKINTPDAIHGSLLGYKELFLNAGMVFSLLFFLTDFLFLLKILSHSLCNRATSKSATKSYSTRTIGITSSTVPSSS